MVFDVSAERAANLLRLSAYPVFSWPLKKTATRYKKLLFTILWHLTILNALLLFLPLLYSIYVYHEDSFILTSAICFSAAVSGLIVKVSTCRLHGKRLQTLGEEMENFLDTAQQEERFIVNKYMKKSLIFCLTLVVTNYAAPILMLYEATFTSNAKLVTPAVYPFSTNSTIIYLLLHIQQSSVGLQCAAGISLDYQATLFVQFVCARIYILATELERVRNHEDLYKFVDKHQRLLRFANDVIPAVSCYALTTIACCCVVIVACSLQFVRANSFASKLQFGPLVLVALITVFVLAWSADNLMDACNNIGIAAYNSPWTDMSLQMRKNILIVLQRSQNPVVSSVGGFMPTLSLRYYGCFVSAVVSYFMTLRAIVDVNK